MLFRSSLRCVFYYGDGRVRFEKNIPVGRKQVSLGDKVQFTLPSFAKGEYALRIFANVNGKEHEAVQYDFFVASKKKSSSKFSIKSDEKGLGKGQTVTLKWNDSKASGYAVKVIRRKGKFTGVVATGLTQDRSFDFVARGSGNYRAYVYPYSYKGETFKMQTADIKVSEKPDVPKKAPTKTVAKTLPAAHSAAKRRRQRSNPSDRNFVQPAHRDLPHDDVAGFLRGGRPQLLERIPAVPGRVRREEEPFFLEHRVGHVGRKLSLDDVETRPGDDALSQSHGERLHVDERTP